MNKPKFFYFRTAFLTPAFSGVVKKLKTIHSNSNYKPAAAEKSDEFIFLVLTVKSAG